MLWPDIFEAQYETFQLEQAHISHFGIERVTAKAGEPEGYSCLRVQFADEPLAGGKEEAGEYHLLVLWYFFCGVKRGYFPQFRAVEFMPSDIPLEFGCFKNGHAITVTRYKRTGNANSWPF